MCSAKQLPNAVTFMSGVMNGSGGSQPSRMKSSIAFCDRMLATFGLKLQLSPRNHTAGVGFNFRAAISTSRATFSSRAARAGDRDAAG
jgi:hypothetical protein